MFLFAYGWTYFKSYSAPLNLCSNASVKERIVYCKIQKLIIFYQETIGLLKTFYISYNLTFNYLNSRKTDLDKKYCDFS